MDVSDAHSMKRAGRSHLHSRVPCIVEPAAFVLDHYNPYRRLFLNISREHREKYSKEVVFEQRWKDNCYGKKWEIIIPKVL